jgi:hypothetical protein
VVSCAYCFKDPSSSWISMKYCNTWSSFTHFPLLKYSSYTLIKSIQQISWMYNEKILKYINMMLHYASFNAWQ